MQARNAEGIYEPGLPTKACATENAKFMCYYYASALESFIRTTPR
jgi:hypothetical protein